MAGDGLSGFGKGGGGGQGGIVFFLGGSIGKAAGRRCPDMTGGIPDETALSRIEKRCKCFYKIMLVLWKYHLHVTVERLQGGETFFLSYRACLPTDEGVYPVCPAGSVGNRRWVATAIGRFKRRSQDIKCKNKLSIFFYK